MYVTGCRIPNIKFVFDLTRKVLALRGHKGPQGLPIREGSVERPSGLQCRRWLHLLARRGNFPYNDSYGLPDVVLQV